MGNGYMFVVHNFASDAVAMGPGFLDIPIEEAKACTFAIKSAYAAG